MKKIVFFAVAALTLSGCSVYHPQAVDIPLMTQKGETHVDAALSISYWAVPDASNINATVTHAFSDHIALQVHGNYGIDTYYGQLAPGYFLPFGNNGVMEVYAGYGFGGVNRDGNKEDDGIKKDFSGHYHLPFAQFNLGCHDLTAVHLDLGFGIKAGYFIPDFSYTKYKDDVETLSQHFTSKHMLLEPQVMVRFGAEKVKFGVKVGYAWLQGFDRDDTDMIFDMITFSAGFTFNF